MSRYAKPNQTIEDLQNAIKDNGGVYEVAYSEAVSKNLSRVNFDLENLERFGTEDSYNHLPGLADLVGYEMLGDMENDLAFPVLWVAAGGDWELPLVFILFIGEDDELHAYIPEDGNCYNKKAKAAYGNNEGDPVYGDNDPRYVFDVAKMKADIENQIIVK